MIKSFLLAEAPDGGFGFRISKDRVKDASWKRIGDRIEVIDTLRFNKF